MRLADVCISYLSKIIYEYCNEKQKNFSVALVSNRKDKKYKDKNFKKMKSNFSKEILQILMKRMLIQSVWQKRPN